MLGYRQKQLWHFLIAHHIEDETDQHQRGDYDSDIENAPKPFPSLALRIEKYLSIRHGRFQILASKTQLDGLGYTLSNRMEPDHQSQSSHLRRRALEIGVAAEHAL